MSQQHDAEIFLIRQKIFNILTSCLVSSMVCRDAEDVVDDNGSVVSGDNETVERGKLIFVIDFTL